MTDQSLFCPFCGAQQLKAEARFCHVCGQALPPRPVPVETPAAPPVTPRRRNWLWLLPLILVLLLIAAVAFAWQRGLLGLGAPGQSAWTPAAVSEGSARASTTPGEPGGTRDAPSPSVPPIEPSQAGSATPLPGTRPPVATATPPPSTQPPPGRLRRRPPRRHSPQPRRRRPRRPPPTATPLPTSTPTATATPITPTPVVGKVVFGSDRSGYAHIFTVRGNGKGLRAITGGNEYFWDPVLSNDGTLVAYVSKVGGNTEVFVARSDGSNARPISNHPAEDDHPSWFPRQRRVGVRQPPRWRLGDLPHERRRLERAPVDRGWRR